MSVKYKYVALTLIPLAIVGYFGFRHMQSYSNINMASVTSVKKQISQAQVEKIQQSILTDLNEQNVSSKESQEEIKYLKSKLLTNQSSKKLFADTYLYLGDNPGTYAAAKFMAAMPVVAGDAEFFSYLSKSQRDLEVNSQEIMDQIDQAQSYIFSDLSFHMASLNLIHQLHLRPERKARFYSATLLQPIFVFNNGQLHDQSYPFEMALAMAKQDNVTGDLLYPAMQELAKSAKGDEQVRDAIRSRVLSYYPEFSGLF